MGKLKKFFKNLFFKQKSKKSILTSEYKIIVTKRDMHGAPRRRKKQ